MALVSLASLSDMDARNIVIPDGVDAQAMLDAASDSIRDAAGCAISRTTSTVTLAVFNCDDQYGIDLPAGPVWSVTSVTLEATLMPAATLANGCWSAGWQKSGNHLTFHDQTFPVPAEITVAYDHGYTVVPRDIVDLACALAAMGATAAGNDYGSSARTGQIKLGDYEEKFIRPAGTESPSPFALPDAVRERLRARFGTSVAVVGMRQ